MNSFKALTLALLLVPPTSAQTVEINGNVQTIEAWRLQRVVRRPILPRPYLAVAPVRAAVVTSVQIAPTAVYTSSICPLSGVVATAPMIVKFGTDGCAPCVQWEAVEAPLWRRRGWLMRSINARRAAVRVGWVTSYPTFRIYTGKRWITHQGYLTTTQAKVLMGL